jgi:hypothetical protein
VTTSDNESDDMKIEEVLNKTKKQKLLMEKRRWDKKIRTKNERSKEQKERANKI